MMYYDRSLPVPLLASLEGGRFFRSLLEMAHSSWGTEALVHVEFRRSKQNKWGSVTVYEARAALLEVAARADTTFTLSADDKYERIAPNVFSRNASASELDGMMGSIEDYLQTATSAVDKQFAEGEGRVHAGLMRRYGLCLQTKDQIVAVDKEVVVGFADIQERRAFGNELRRRFGDAHRKLDTIGVLADGNIAIVEIKKQGESLTKAAIQAASHVFTFERLEEQYKSGESLRGTLNRLIDQKVAVGLLPDDTFRAKPDAALVPVIAAPDKSPEWHSRWRSGIHDSQRKHDALLKGLQLWRLSDEGEVKDIVVA